MNRPAGRSVRQRGTGQKPEAADRHVPGLAARKTAAKLLAVVIDARTPLDGLTDNDNGHPHYLALDPRDRGLVRAILTTALRYRVTIGFSAGDRAALTRIMAAGRRSAEAERIAVGRAGAWFDKRIAPEAGTKGHVARAGVSHMYDRGQFDCVDSSRNTTALLLVLAELKLLHHHRVDVPVARGAFFDARPPHVTAVLTENEGGRQWAVDSWTRGYGQAPEIMPLARWKTLD